MTDDNKQTEFLEEFQSDFVEIIEQFGVGKPIALKAARLIISIYLNSEIISEYNSQSD
jgi:hypothetical protein